MNSQVRMPVLFLGHGSPMNAIEENEFVHEFRKLGRDIPKPEAVLCISAHWETRGTHVTAMPKPPTIHDFGGFPPELYEVQYPAPGSPELAQYAKESVNLTEVGLDQKWGLDHGAWSVIKHIFPAADVPVIQMSLDYTKSAGYHYELARQLGKLRDRGVLITGSGNMVHNLRLIDWRKLNDEYAFDWAVEAIERIKFLVAGDDHDQLIRIRDLGRAYELAIPTPEHYLPLLYVMALKDKDDTISFFNDKPVGGSVYMTSVRIEGS